VRYDPSTESEVTTSSQGLFAQSLFVVGLFAPGTFATGGANEVIMRSALPVGTDLVRIQAVRWRPEPTPPLDFKTRGQLDDQYPGWEVDTGPKPKLWTLENPHTVRLFPMAETAIDDSIEMSVAIMPQEGILEIPDWLYAKHRDDMLNGILALIHKMPGREWTDPRSAQDYGASYEMAVEKLRLKAEASFGSPTYQTTYGGI
jgi:hypothetical protein